MPHVTVFWGFGFSCWLQTLPILWCLTTKGTRFSFTSTYWIKTKEGQWRTFEKLDLRSFGKVVPGRRIILLYKFRWHLNSYYIQFRNALPTESELLLFNKFSALILATAGGSSLLLSLQGCASLPRSFEKFNTPPHLHECSVTAFTLHSTHRLLRMKYGRSHLLENEHFDAQKLTCGFVITAALVFGLHLLEKRHVFHLHKRQLRVSPQCSLLARANNPS